MWWFQLSRSSFAVFSFVAGEYLHLVVVVVFDVLCTFDMSNACLTFVVCVSRVLFVVLSVHV